MTITVNSFLAALRARESGGRYALGPQGGSTASGAYQYVDGTWANYHGFAHAWQAPPAVQDAKATQDVMAKWQAYNEDWAKVAASWYAGPYFVQTHPDKSTWNVVPHPEAGNRLTVAEYATGMLKQADTGSGGGGITSIPGKIIDGVTGVGGDVAGAAKNAVTAPFKGLANDIYKIAVTIALLGTGLTLIGVGVVRLAGSSKSVQTVEQVAPLVAAA